LLERFDQEVDQQARLRRDGLARRVDREDAEFLLPLISGGEPKSVAAILSNRR